MTDCTRMRGDDARLRRAVPLSSLARPSTSPGSAFFPSAILSHGDGLPDSAMEVALAMLYHHAGRALRDCSGMPTLCEQEVVVQADSHSKMRSPLYSPQHDRAKWIHARFWWTWAGSVLLVTILGPFAMASVMLAHQWSIGGIVRHGYTTFALMSAFMGGIIISIPVAAMLFRRRPAISLAAVYGVVYCITLAWPHYYEIQNIHHAGRLGNVASVAALCTSFVACLAWLAFDWRNSRGWMPEFEVQNRDKEEKCANCGYTLHSRQVERCSECGASTVYHDIKQQFRPPDSLNNGAAIRRGDGAT